MVKPTITPRKAGRPRSEESVAIALERSMIHIRGEFARITPKAIQTLEKLLDSGTEKVKETTAKYIIEQAKEVHSLYTQEDNDLGEKSTGANSVSEKDAPRSAIPLTTTIREYKMAEGED